MKHPVHFCPFIQEGFVTRGSGRKILSGCWLERRQKELGGMDDAFVIRTLTPLYIIHTHS